MKLIICWVVVAVLAGCASTQGGSQVSRNPADIAGVRAATNQWVDAYNSRDPARINAAYAPDAVFWGTTSKTIRTTPADVAEYFKDAGKRPDARVKVTDEHTRVWGDVGVNTGSYTFMDLAQKSERPARFTMIFLKRDGKWVLMEHHSSEVK